MSQDRTYVSVDLKSFYASAECVERGLDPLTTNLLVADSSRTEKTICLAVSPSLKAYGISGRARLFEAIQSVKAANATRLSQAPGRQFTGASHDAKTLQENPSLAIDYIIAPPRMALYIEYSTRVYEVYLKYVAQEDIINYSIDEVFMDITAYLASSGLNAHDFTRRIIQDVLKTTGITATAGIGTNLYLAKVAMDIMAKRVQPDRDGVRIAELDEMTYRRQLWDHRPLTDFWRVGRGYARKLEEHGLYTMGDIARCSIGKPTDYHNEGLLYKLFGVNAELLVDHSWGWEPCTIADIRAYKPSSNSVGSGQVLQYPYDFEKAKLIVREMTDLLVLDLVEKRLVTDQIVLTIGYDIENLKDPEISRYYTGPVTVDHYGRKVPKHAHGTANLDRHTSSTKQITEAVMALYNRIVDPKLLVRRVTLAANRVVDEQSVPNQQPYEQLDLFSDYSAIEKQREKEAVALERERRQQEAILNIRKRFGKNAILKGMNLQDGATTKDRNKQIGGHKA